MFYKKNDVKLRQLILSSSIILLILSLASYAPWSVFIIDIASHFVLQYAIASIFLAGLGLFLKISKYTGIIILISAALNTMQLANFYTGSELTAHRQTERLTILQANTYTENKNVGLLNKFVLQKKPDIIIIAEINQVFKDHFLTIKDIYPYQFYGTKVAIISKIQLINTAEELLPDYLVLRTVDAALTVITFHTPTPIQNLKQRDMMFDNIGDWISENKPHNILLLGDINATPYCPALKALSMRVNLKNARTGHGIYGTYPTWLPAFARLPIDQIMANRSLKIVSFELGPNIGSDHLPSIAEVVF